MTGRVRGLAATGLLATLVAMAATAAVAAIARAVGVDFAVSNSDETIPVSGIAVVTGFFAVVGVVVAAALRRWSARPAEWFVRTAVTLTAVSLVPPVLLGADAATSTALVGLHLIAAAVMIPTLARRLRSPSTTTRGQAPLDVLPSRDAHGWRPTRRERADRPPPSSPGSSLGPAG